MKIRDQFFDFCRKRYIMGILNMTPDSFSDGGSHGTLDKALYHTEAMIRDGASIIDVGGESTRPGYREVAIEEEIERTAPVIEAIRARFDTVISIDTYKYSVAGAGLDAGADIINDVWGLKWDWELKGAVPDEETGQMARLIAARKVPCILAHNRTKAASSHFLSHFFSDMEETLAIAEGAGIGKDQIILDPGIGFGKTKDQNLLLLASLDQMRNWGFPLLLGVSRKSVIGDSLGLPVDQREEGTMALTVMAAMSGASIFRVHDVKANARALKMAGIIIERKHERQV